MASFKKPDESAPGAVSYWRNGFFGRPAADPVTTLISQLRSSHSKVKQPLRCQLSSCAAGRRPLPASSWCESDLAERLGSLACAHNRQR